MGNCALKLFIISNFFVSSTSNSTGHWSTDGCHKDEKLSNDKVTVCHCNHLTHFAVLMRVTDDKTVSTKNLPSFYDICSIQSIWQLYI